MQTYIDQLLEDLQEAAKTRIEAPNYKVLYPDHPSNDYEGLEDILAFECAPRNSFSSVFDIQSEVFPPFEKLTDQQAEDICEAIMNLWSVNNLQIDLPSDTNIPIKNLYNELITYWKEQGIQILPGSDGTVHMDFCTYEEESCPWGSENCTCEAQFRKEYEEREKAKKDEISKEEMKKFRDDNPDLPL